MFFHSKRSDNRTNSSSSMKLDVRLKKIRSCIVLKDAITKNFVSNEHHSFTFTLHSVSSSSTCRPTDRLHLKFPFSRAETDVLVPVFSQSSDVIVVIFLVVLNFPVIECFFAIMAYVPNTSPSKDPLLYKCHLYSGAGFKRGLKTPE